MIKYILAAPFCEIRTRPANAIGDCGQGNAKTADKFLVTCLPFEAVIRLYRGLNLYLTSTNMQLEIPTLGQQKTDKIGVFAEHIFFMFLLCKGEIKRIPYVFRRWIRTLVPRKRLVASRSVVSAFTSEQRRRRRRSALLRCPKPVARSFRRCRF